MATQRKPKLYLAGPDVFRPDPLAHAEKQRALCAQYGFTPLHPVDNGPAFGAQSVAALMRLCKAVRLYHTDPRPALMALPSEAMRCAMKIYLGNIKYVRECDIVVANCNAFRGALVDDGTAYELLVVDGVGLPKEPHIFRRQPRGGQPGVPLVNPARFQPAAQRRDTLVGQTPSGRADRPE